MLSPAGGLGDLRDRGALRPVMRIYAAMTQKERELISERTRAALAAAKARGKALGSDRGYRPPMGPDTAAAAMAWREAAEQAAHRLVLEVERLRDEGIVGQAAIARALTERGVSAPRGGAGWIHTTVARVLARSTPRHATISLNPGRHAEIL